MRIYSRVLLGISAGIAAAFALLSFGYLSVHSLLFKHAFSGNHVAMNTTHDRGVSQEDPKRESSKVAYVSCGGFLN